MGRLEIEIGTTNKELTCHFGQIEHAIYPGQSVLVINFNGTRSVICLKHGEIWLREIVDNLSTVHTAVQKQLATDAIQEIYE